MMRVFFSLVLLLASTLISEAQSDTAWKKFSLGISSAEATKLLGNPDGEKKTGADFEPALSEENRKRKDFRKLTFKNVSGWPKSTYSFLDDKLAAIELWPKNKTVPAAELSSRFGAEFLFIESFSKSISLASFEGQKETTVPKVYPARYHMVAILPDRYVIALINNGSFKAIWKDGFNLPTIRTFPGFVENISIYSRELDK